MFVDELRRVIETAPKNGLPDVAKALWSAVAGGQIAETDAEILSGLIDARRAVPASVPTKKWGTRPRSSGSIERRRRWASSGALPVGLAARFSIAEQAVLAVVAGEVKKHGYCSLFIGHIAALAGVGETSVRNALRSAKQLGLIAIEIRRVTAWRNEANIVTVVSAEWSMWLAHGGRGGGCRSVKGTVLRSKPIEDVHVQGSEDGGSRRACRQRWPHTSQVRPEYPLKSPGKAVQADSSLSRYSGARS